ncbi:MAG TPA: helix-turn-helix domain-containing protein [Gemmataceae bacterium]|jgi:AcrR family transcriptional regulator|nr:helix-turn-helix domain-containing protein [Gemmataceae bacterium]
MKVQAKLSGEERRAAIIQAVRRVFADKGFHGTTTRELADAAGVSEALLFKHFPNKEALYSAMQLSCCNPEKRETIERIKALEPSTSTLVLMVHLMVSKMIGGRRQNGEDEAAQHRLMLHSLMEDGDFARLFLKGRVSCWLSKVEECIKAAVAAGDASAGPVRATLAGWFTHHLAALVMIHLIPDSPVIDYGLPRDKLTEQAVWFALRGIGLKEEAIKRHYNPKALALLLG